MDAVRPSGHLQVVQRAGGQRWHALWRDADGRHQKVLGPAWVRDNGKRTTRGGIAWRAAHGPKPTPRHLTPADAEDQLRSLLADAPRFPAKPRPARGPASWMSPSIGSSMACASVGSSARPTATIATPSITTCVPTFGDYEIRSITRVQIEVWHGRYPRSRTAEKVLMILGAIFRHAHRRDLIVVNPVERVERHPMRYSGDYDLFSREEIDALIGQAVDHQDAAIYLTAALTGLRRGELLALRWRDVDFAGQAIRVRANLSGADLVTPKSGKVRVVPMIDDVAAALAQLGNRAKATSEDEPVFVSPYGGHLDASALRRRYAAARDRAQLRPLPFHSLRHFFGSTAVNNASLVQVQTWMGHAHIQTTARYLHHRTQAQDAMLLAEAFARDAPRPPSAVDASVGD